MYHRTSLAILGALFATGCAYDAAFVAPGDDFEQASESDSDTGFDAIDGVVLHEDTVILDDDPCLMDVHVPADREVLTFDFGCDPTDRGVEPGAIVVGSHGGGYLRRVVSVAVEDYRLTAWTEFAAVNEAIVEGDMSFTVGEDSERALIDLGNTTLYGDEVAGSHVLFRLEEAALDINPLIDIDGHWAEGKVQTFDFDASLGITGDLSVLLQTTAGLRYKDSFPIWETSWPFTTAIGPLPVVGDVGIRVSAGYVLDAPGHLSVTAGAGGTMGWSASHHYRDGEGWTNDNDATSTWEVQTPDLDISTSATARVFLRAEVFIRMWGVAGPQIRTGLYGNTTADANCDAIDWFVKAGLTARAQVKLNILDKFKPTKTFATVDFTADLAEGSIDYPVGFPIPCAQPEIACGDAVEGDTTGLEAQLSGYSCNVGNYDAPEAIYEFVAPGTGEVEWALVDPTPMAVNHDVIVLDGGWNLVNADCLTWGSNSVTFDAVEGETYYLVVDGYDEDAGPYQAQVTCETQSSSSGDDDPLGDSDPFE